MLKVRLQERDLEDVDFQIIVSYMGKKRASFHKEEVRSHLKIAQEVALKALDRICTP